MTRFISNSLNREVVITYRVKDGPLISVSIQPRAILNEIAFNSEEHYNAFRRSADYFFKNNILIEGKKVTEEELVSKNEELAVKTTAEKSVKTDKTLDSIAESATNVADNFELKVEKAQKTKTKKA